MRSGSSLKQRLNPFRHAIHKSNSHITYRQVIEIKENHNYNLTVFFLILRRSTSPNRAGQFKDIWLASSHLEASNE